MLRFFLLSFAICGALARSSGEPRLVAHADNAVHLVAHDAALPDGKSRFQYSPGKFLNGYRMDGDPKEFTGRFGWQAESHKAGYLSPHGDYVKTGPGQVMTTPNVQALKAGALALAGWPAVVVALVATMFFQ